ncbi:hypothetical protein MP228_008965 [Amoeboaphelidium protococcarum]|nr:hypothetical protein MP228_008965 [Amoeboaphelidium protococcarum]
MELDDLLYARFRLQMPNVLQQDVQRLDDLMVGVRFAYIVGLYVQNMASFDQQMEWRYAINTIESVDQVNKFQYTLRVSEILRQLEYGSDVGFTQLFYPQRSELFAILSFLVQKYDQLCTARQGSLYGNDDDNNAAFKALILSNSNRYSRSQLREMRDSWRQQLQQFMRQRPASQQSIRAKSPQLLQSQQQQQQQQQQMITVQSVIKETSGSDSSNLIIGKELRQKIKVLREDIKVLREAQQLRESQAAISSSAVVIDPVYIENARQFVSEHSTGEVQQKQENLQQLLQNAQRQLNEVQQQIVDQTTSFDQQLNQLQTEYNQEKDEEVQEIVSKQQKIENTILYLKQIETKLDYELQELQVQASTLKSFPSRQQMIDRLKTLNDLVQKDSEQLLQLNKDIVNAQQEKESVVDQSGTSYSRLRQILTSKVSLQNPVFTQQCLSLLEKYHNTVLQCAQSIQRISDQQIELRRLQNQIRVLQVDERVEQRHAALVEDYRAHRLKQQQIEQTS